MARRRPPRRPRLAALSKGGEPREAQIAVTADGIRSADPSSKLLTPPRPVEAALAPPQLQRWPCRCCPLRRRAATALLEPLAHGTKQVHEQVSTRKSAVDHLQPQQLARSSKCLDCISRYGTELARERIIRYLVCVASLSGLNALIYTQYRQNFRACGGQASPQTPVPKPQFTPQPETPDLS